MPMKVRYTVADGEVVSEVRNGIRRDYVPDPLGSTVALLDDTQSVTDSWEYWPYGEVRSGSSVTPFQYVGTLGYYKDTSRRSYVRARHYRQNLGRWLTVDRLWPQETIYGYAADEPQSLIDPMGDQVITSLCPPIKPGDFYPRPQPAPLCWPDCSWGAGNNSCRAADDDLKDCYKCCKDLCKPAFSWQPSSEPACRGCCRRALKKGPKCMKCPKDTLGAPGDPF